MSSQGQRLTPLEMLAKLVSFDTVSSKSNLPLIEFVESYLQSWNVPYVRVPNETGDKAALYATIGPQDRGGIVLSGHTDVVPVTGQAWTSDPFTLRVENGRAYGRGAVDMKAFDALALALIPEFQAANLNTPIHILLSYDEETTCLGVVDVIRRLGHDLPMPKAAIVGEPTMMEVVDAHKSVVTFSTTVHGFEAHSSKPYLGASAVMTAAELIAELNRIGDEMMERGDTSGRFDPPYTTVHVGTIAGGTARNILSKSCSFHWEFRGLPSLDPQEIPSRLETVRAGGRAQAPQPLRRVRADRDEARGGGAGPCAGSGIVRGDSRPAACRQEPARRPCPSARRRAIIRRPAFRRSSAVPARSIRRISRTNTSRWTSSRQARPSCGGSLRRVRVLDWSQLVMPALAAGIARLVGAGLRRPWIGLDKPGHDASR